MNKKEIQQRVLQEGKRLALNKFNWCEDTKTFSSKENNLALDFKDIWGVTFKAGSYCTFKAGSYCTFKTGSDCTFDTGSGCTFKTWSDCTFDTGSGCTFDTWSGCTFKTGSGCTFKTGSGCTFNTRNRSVIIRRDVYEVIEIPEGKIIKLNGYKVKGYKIMDKDN